MKKFLANQTSRKYIGFIICVLIALIFGKDLPPYILDFIFKAYIVFVGANIAQDIVEKIVGKKDDTAK